jgi:solute carrier family 25 2-oxodicarboxylate transporter 21
MVSSRCSAGRLYRGLIPPLMLEAPKRAVKFAANDFWGQTYKKTFKADKMSQSLSVLTGCSAGATESIGLSFSSSWSSATLKGLRAVVVPFELVKIRLQDRASAGKYKGPLDCVSQIVRSEGVLGLYAGLEPTFWRSILPFFSRPSLHELNLASPLIGMSSGTAVISVCSSD